MRSFESSPRALSLAWALLSICSLGCSSNDDPAKGTGNGHAYALQTMVYQPDESVMAYLALTDTLDVQDISLAQAQELSSYAFVTSVGGKLLVSSGDRPTITQYDVTDTLELDLRDSVSFLNQGVTQGGAGLERHWFLDEETAYLTLETTGRVVWNPTTLDIIDVKDESSLEPTRDGFQLDAAFNRPPQLLEGPVLKPFVYHDESWFHYADSSVIAVYDPVTHEEKTLLDVPCPGLEVSSQDEAGNTYFSSWTYGPTLSLFGEGPAPCIARVKPNATLDESFTTDFSAWTEGRPTMVFRYLAKGKALATVLHVDEADVDFAAGYDEDAATALDSLYRLWLIDLDDQSAKPVQGVGSVASGFNVAILEDRTFLFVPNEEWSATTVFELDLDGSASERFAVDGVVNNWVKVR